MTQPGSDQLVQCLDRLLNSVNGDEDPEIFIDRVAEEYLMELVRQAHIPLRYLATLRDDVRTEIQDLLRVRAYGYPSLDDYLRSLAQQPRRSTT
jgi:hypothetical protein